MKPQVGRGIIALVVLVAIVLLVGKVVAFLFLPVLLLAVVAFGAYALLGKLGPSRRGPS